MLSFDVSVVVLGMHRSGTSALARLIGLHGFNMPATLLEKSESNQSGFWESSKINSFNNEILGQFEQSWFSLDPIDPNVMDSAVRDQFLLRAGNLLREEYGDAQRIILKDPRCCRIGWIWLDVLKEMSRRVVVPIAVRNPVEVAQSLMVRNGFDPEFGYLVWLRNYLDAEYNSRHVRRDFLSYDMLLDDWRGAVARLSENLKLPLKIGPEEAAELDAFVNPALRHHSTDHQAVLDKISGNPWVHAVYEILHAASQGNGIGRAEMAKLDAIRRAFDAAAPSFSSFVSNARLERKKADSLREQATQFKRELGESRKISGDLSALGRQTGEQSKALERLNATVSAMREALKETFAAQLEEARRIENAANLEKAAALTRLDLAEKQAHILRDQLERRQLELGEAKALQQQLSTDRDLAREEMQRISERLRLAEARELQLSIARNEAQSEAQRLCTARNEAESEAQRLSDMVKNLTAQRDESGGKLVTVKRRHHELADKYSELKKKSGIWKREIQVNEQALIQVRQELQRMQRTWPWRLHLFVKSGLDFVSFGRLRTQRQDKRQIHRHMEVIERSGLFDAEWYCARYTDVRESGMKPLLHYVKYGWREGRDPSAQFSGRIYLDRNFDVAAAEMDPLLHFVEHGRSEGRGPVSAELAPPPQRPVAISPYAGPAHPVYLGVASSKKRLPTWRRWAEIKDGESSETFALGSTVLALGPREASTFWQEQADQLLALFQAVSGHPSGRADLHEGVTAALQAMEHAAELADAWFVSDFSLRLRWKVAEGADALVIRGFQLSAETGECRIVGEAPVQRELDLVDLDLLNPLYPILIVGSDLEGHLAFLTLLAFPSAFRGGVHYAEWVATHDAGSGGLACPLDLSAFSGELLDWAAKLIGGQRAFLRCLRVDIREADGSEPLIAEHVQQWLGRCLGIRLEPGPSDPARSKANDYLLDRLTDGPRETPLYVRREGGAVMTLAANDMPSLKLLLSGAEAATSIEVSPKERVAAAYIVADRNSGLPKALIAPPPGARKIVDDLVLLNGGASAPYYSAEEAFRSPDVTAAIRFKDARKPGPGELLAPVAPDIYPLVEAAQKAGTVLVIAGPGCFNSENFLDTLETLKNQVGVDALSLQLLGGGQDIPQNVLHACDATFGGRYSVAGQGPAPKGETVLFLDTGIVFHDRRALHLLTELLASPAVASASCMLIGGEEGRKGWAAEALFGGYAVQRRFGDDERLLPFTDIGWLVRDVYAVAAPSPLFWVARRADLDLARMMSAPHDGDDRLACLRRGDDRFHVCTTLLSATLTSPEGKARLSVVPEAPAIAGTRFLILRG